MDLKVQRLSRIDEGIEKIESLHLLPDVLSLNLHANQIETISGLDRLTHLVELDISANSIEKVSGLESLVCLKILNLSSNSIGEITPQEMASLVSLRHLNLSYNMLMSLGFLPAFANKESSLQELFFHGNQISHVQSTCQMLDCTKTLERITIADNPITSSAETIFASCPHIISIDGVSRDGRALPPLVFSDSQPSRNPQTSQNPTPRNQNPWVQEEIKKPMTADDFGLMAQKMLEQAQTRILAESAAREQEQTNSKIDRLEKQLQKLINQNKQAPLPSASAGRKPRPPTNTAHSKCSKCANAMKEMRQMATSFEQQTNTLQEEILKMKNEAFALQRLTEDQQLDINQKTSQLQTALDGLVKFKDLAKAEREKNESHEQTLARTLKEFSNEKRAMKNLQEELNKLKHHNEKQAEENRNLSIANEKLVSEASAMQSKYVALEKELKLAQEKLSVSIHPDSPEMQNYVKDKLQVAVKYMEEYKTDAKKRYSALEQEFREALKIEDNEKNKLREKIDKLKEEHAELRINQERLFFSEKKAKDTVDMVASGAKELKARNSELEDKIDRLVDAVRKAKELADQRYKDEQRSKQALQESQKTKAKLIATLTEQEGIVNGLKAEREQWSKGLASQTSDLAKEKGNLIAENDALKQKLAIEAQNEKKLRIKEKELDSAQQQIQDLKAKLDQKRKQAFEMQAECDSQIKHLEKAERRLARGEADREHLLEEKEKFYAQKKANEEKWRERTIVIENLEEKLAHFSVQKQQKENELNCEIAEKDKIINELQSEIGEKEKSFTELEAKLKTVIHFEEDNRKLARLVRAQALKIKQVEDELRDLLRDRENDRLSLQKKFQDFAKNLAK